MSFEAKKKTQVAAAFAALGLTKSEVLAIFADDEPSGSAMTEDQQLQGGLDLPSSTAFPMPATPSQEVASPTAQQLGSVAPTQHTASATTMSHIGTMSQTAAASHLVSAPLQGHVASTPVMSTHPGPVEPRAGPQGLSVGGNTGFGRAVEYFGTQAAPPSGPGIDALRSLAAQPFAPVSNAAPTLRTPQYFSLPSESRGQWGSSGTVTAQLPSHVPSALGSMLAPSYGPTHASTSSTPSSAPRFGTTAARPRPPTAPTRNRQMNNIDRVVIIPSPLYERYTAYLSYACQRAGLSSTISLETGFTKEVVFQTLAALFEGKVNLHVFHFEWMFLTQKSGDILIEANIPPRPSGIEIAKAYQKKSVIFLRLQMTAVPLLPRFREFIRARCSDLGKSAARLLNDEDLLEEGEDMVKTDPVEEEGEFECDKCGGVFLSLSRAPHLLNCIGLRKRTVSARHTTTATANTVDPSSSPERIRRPIKKVKPSVRAPPSRGHTTPPPGSRNIKLRLRSATPAAQPLAESDEEADQLGDDEGMFSESRGGGDKDEEDEEDEEEDESDGNEDGVDDDYGDYLGSEDEHSGFKKGSGSDHRAGSQASVPTPSLCPFCDEILPEAISPAFQDALTSALRSAIRKPSPSNPDHHELGWTRSIAVCAIHRAQTVSEASGLSWPTSINFSQVPVRLSAHRQDLLAVLEGASTAHAVLEEFRNGSRPLTSTGAKLGALKYSHAG